MLNIILVSLALVLVLARFIQRRRRFLPLPPGPPKLPLIGNLLDMPKDRHCAVFHEWAKKYGSDVLHVDAAGQSMVILDSYESTIDVLDKKSAVTSSRPTLPMAGELMGLVEWDFVLMPYGETWRSHRRLFHQTLHEGAARVFRPQQQKNAIRLLSRLLTTPEQFLDHVTFLAASSVIFIAYGVDIEDHNDPILRNSIELLDRSLPALVPGTYLVDLFPFLKYVPRWFPGATFQQDALLTRQVGYEALNLPFQTTKSMMEDGTAQPSFVSLALGASEKESDKAELETLVSNVAGIMYIAGSDTSDALLATAIYVLLLYPDVQQKAQEELDRVIAPGHLPSFEDEDSLPYLTAVLLETMRWNPVVPFGVPHFLEDEDTYRGYRLPKNSILIGNSWGILRDEERFPNPDKFDPERFIKNGMLEPSVLDPRNVIFGFGRRICPGRHLAISTVWIALASIISTFDILPAKDDTRPQVAMFDELSIIRHPLPFKCSIKPRSEKAAQLIHSATL